MAQTTGKRLIKVTCTNCNTSYTVDLKKIPNGKAKGKCKKCDTLITVDIHKPSIKRQHSPEPPKSNVNSKPQKSIASKELSICPKCNHKQAKSEECEKCGIIYTRYLSSRAEAFNQTILTIGKKGLRYGSEEFEKLISRFPETKTICDRYLTAIDQAMMEWAKKNLKKSRDTLTALLEEQPNLSDSIKPFLSMIKLKEEKEATDKATVNVNIPGMVHCEEQGSGPHVKCPKCNSIDIALGKRGYKLGPASIVGTVAIGPAMLLCGFAGQGRPMRVCLNCKHKW